MHSREPIAIVGMSCRFAGGVDSPAEFWRLLRAGGDVIGELPEGRWDWYASQGHEYAQAVQGVTRRGAFLDDIRSFDADFFGITPREAALMDPQQRLALELAWEALEHAGIVPRDLTGSDTGVFMGIGADDYGRRLLEDLPRIEAWSGIGGAYCAVANRISHALDFRGPSMAVDTACSSSLVAIHLAVQALRAGECPVALAGGVLVMAAPGLSLVLDSAGATAPDGRSKSFNADADGYGRGEGGGIVVLKRLSDARRDGDRVLAVIRGSAVHHDGHTNGIMAPNGEAQAHLMRLAYKRSGIDPASVDYVEAHGTGTRAGDPLEAQAISSVFAPGRTAKRPLLIGSVKPNVGHLEAGAGVAGVIKTVLALQHREIPPSLNFTRPNPAIPWDTARLRVVTEPTTWPQDNGPRRAGVSAYGYGGTLAHLVLEQGDAQTAPVRDKDGLALYPLSAQSPAALAQQAGLLASLLMDDEGPATADVGHTLARRRASLSHRAVVLARGRAELVDRLQELAASGTDSATGSVLPGTGRGLVWVFSGHGSQWTGMARELLAEEPAFAEVIDRLEPVFAEEMGISPRAALLEEAAQPVDVIQPLIFAVQVALAAVWRAYGVRPDAVVGHSVGEIAAAVTAGSLTMEQGARLVCRRSRLLRQVAGQGAMAMVNLPREEALARLGDRRDVAVAVAASPYSSVISGDVVAVADLCKRWRAEGLHIRNVDSDVAFHSPQMEPLLEALAAAAADLPPQPPRIPLYSTALEDPRSGVARDGAYWAANLGGQVRFAQGVAAAVEDGYRLFAEISAHPVVEHSVTEILAALGVHDGFATHSLRRGRPELETLLGNLALLHCHGGTVDWSAVWPEGAPTDLPGTVWQRREHWADEPVVRSTVTAQHDPANHTLLGGQTRVNGTTEAHVWRTILDRASRPYPGSHPVRDVEIVPAAVLLNTFLAAAAATGPWRDLANVVLRVPVSVSRLRTVQVVLQDGTVRLSSRLGDGTDGRGWIPHTVAALEPHAGLGGRPAEPAAAEPLPADHVVDRLAALGVAAMGFPWKVEDLRRGDGTLAARIRVDSERRDGTAPETWAPVLDAALSIASVCFPGPPILRMPAHIRRVTLAETAPARARVTVRLVGEDAVDVEITDPVGTVVGKLSHLRYGALDRDAGAVANPRRLVHTVAWRELAVPSADRPRPVVLIGPHSPLLSELTGHLKRTGVPYRVAPTPEDLTEADLGVDNTLVVVSAPGSLDAAEESAARASWLVARTAQRLAGSGVRAPARLWCVTQGVHECRDVEALGYGPLWGVGRVIGGEYPEFWGGVVDIGTSPRDVPRLWDVVRAVRGEDVVVVRDGRPQIPRLRRLEGDPVKSPLACRPDGTYLITGGLGALGLQVARWLADRGARRIVLAGRRALPPRDMWDSLTDPREIAKISEIRALERLGVTVTTVAVDIADSDASAKLLSAPSLGLPPIRGVVHAAGVLDNRTLRTLDEESLRTVLRPKVRGALVLHKMFPPKSVEFFVLFSSAGQLLGLPGQASYAAGNAFLDALAAHRRALGETAATSFAWTSWRGLGMSTSSEVIDAELAARGTADISLAEAFSSWELADRYGLGFAAVLRTLPPQSGQRQLPLLSELPEDTPAGQSAAGGAALWEGLPGPELHKLLCEEIRGQVAHETRLSAAEVDVQRSLIDMGVDSVMTVRIRVGLERRFGIPLPTTLLWDRPTINAIADLLAERVTEAAPSGGGERPADLPGIPVDGDFPAGAGM